MSCFISSLCSAGTHFFSTCCYLNAIISAISHSWVLSIFSYVEDSHSIYLWFASVRILASSLLSFIISLNVSLCWDMTLSISPFVCSVSFYISLSFSPLNDFIILIFSCSDFSFFSWVSFSIFIIKSSDFELFFVRRAVFICAIFCYSAVNALASILASYSFETGVLGVVAAIIVYSIIDSSNTYPRSRYFFEQCSLSSPTH